MSAQKSKGRRETSTLAHTQSEREGIESLLSYSVLDQMCIRRDGRNDLEGSGSSILVIKVTNILPED